MQQQSRRPQKCPPMSESLRPADNISRERGCDTITVHRLFCSYSTLHLSPIEQQGCPRTLAFFKQSTIFISLGLVPQCDLLVGGWFFGHLSPSLNKLLRNLKRHVPGTLFHPYTFKLLQTEPSSEDREGSDIMLIKYSEMRRGIRGEKKRRDSRWLRRVSPPPRSAFQ